MFLSICTPTYNRAHTLSRTYESLLSQTNTNFEWIIIDDGSIDETKSLVEKWINEDLIKIDYYFQENQGKHIALNKGMEYASGELFTCLDSDDWLYEDAIEFILNKWKTLKSNRNLAGIITLDSFENNEIVGTKFPLHLSQINWIDMVFKYRVKGDKAYYFRTDIIKNYPFPNYKNNKHMPPSYQYYQISKKYNFFIVNKPTKFVEYLEDGISRNKYRKYVIAPDNFAFYRLIIMDLIPTFKRKVINAIHFNSSIYLGNIKFKPNSFKNSIYVFFTKPLGFLLSRFIKFKAKREIK